jgi:hypothetical protein
MVNPILTSDRCGYRIVCLNLGYFFDEATHSIDFNPRFSL